MKHNHNKKYFQQFKIFHAVPTQNIVPIQLEFGRLAQTGKINLQFVATYFFFFFFLLNFKISYNRGMFWLSYHDGRKGFIFLFWSNSPSLGPFISPYTQHPEFMCRKKNHTYCRRQALRGRKTAKNHCPPHKPSQTDNQSYMSNVLIFHLPHEVVPVERSLAPSPWANVLRAFLKYWFTLSIFRPLITTCRERQLHQEQLSGSPVIGGRSIFKC